MNLDQPIIPDDELFKDVNLGHEAEKFLKHNPMGRMLADRALFEYKNAVYDFEGMSIADILKSPEDVAQLRYRIEQARSFIVWVNETITHGDRAAEELGNRDMSDHTID